MSSSEFADQINEILSREKSFKPTYQEDEYVDSAKSLIRRRIQSRGGPLEDAIDAVEEELDTIIRERLMSGKSTTRYTPVREGIREFILELKGGW